MIKIVITDVPVRYMGYYRYLILGFYELKKQGKIDFKIKPGNLLSAILFREYRFYFFIKKYAPFLILSKKKSLTMKGFCVNGSQKTDFVYDIDDTPYHFVINDLEKVNYYFKAQCPISIGETGFELAPGASIKFQPEVLKFKQKIYPAMLAPLYNCNSLYSHEGLNTQYQKMFSDKISKEKILMAYFGNAKGPNPIAIEKPDLYHEESHILGYFKDKVSHPNEKRAIASKIISELGPDYEARVIDDGHRDENKVLKNQHLFIPLSEFSDYISKFSYNLNISGYRTSIPFRFVQSFSVGTAIITDKLKIKWYRPFNKEVFETIEMGYLPHTDVNWALFKEKITNLPQVTSDEVIAEFSNKWSPQAFAGYIIETLTSKKI